MSVDVHGGSVLDLNAFERQMKAEGLGTAAEGNAGTDDEISVRHVL